MIWCKVKEIFYVMVMEVKYFKVDILNIYMNWFYLGVGVCGFEVVL